MSSKQFRSKGASDGQSLLDRTRKGKKSSDQQTIDQQSSPQPEQHTRPGSAQQQAGDLATPATSPAPRAESTPLQATGLMQNQLFKWACYPGWAHHKYNYQLLKLEVLTFPQCLVLSLQKTGSAVAAMSRRCVIRKLQP